MKTPAVALRSVRAQALKDLACPSVDLKILNDAEVPARLEVFAATIAWRRDGLRNVAIYRAECRDEDLCDVSRESCWGFYQHPTSHHAPAQRCVRPCRFGLSNAPRLRR
ncbi:MAG: hypothetical protein U1E83_09060 [Methylotetracoccus sp.]